MRELPNTVVGSWSRSRDYAGRDFRAYINPNFYQRIGKDERFTLRDYLSLESNNQFLVLNDPFPTSAGTDFTPQQIFGGQVSPEIPQGVYQKDTVASVFYWFDGKQIAQSYRLVSFNNLQFEELFPEIEKTITQEILEWAFEFVPQMPEFNEERRLGQILNSILDRIDYGNVIGVWIPSFRVIEDISAVTGSAPSQGLLGSIGGIQSEEEKVRSFLPFLVSGLGLATGSPVLIGSGFVLRYLESVRK